MPKYSRTKDPHRTRENKKYKNPVPSREFIMQYLQDQGRPVAAADFLRDFGLKSAADKQAFQWRLSAMIRDGQLMKNRRNHYALVEDLDLIKGRVQGHRDGFGFVVPDDGSEDLFLSPKEMRGVMHGDRVLVRSIKSGRSGKLEGSVAEILEHANETVVGRYYKENGLAYVVPASKQITKDIVIPADEPTDAKNGEFVLVEMLHYPAKHRAATGRVAEILGGENQAGMEIEVALRSNDLPYQWPEAVLDQVKQIADKVQLPKGKGYQDRRKLPFVTIDGEDARDFDDAIYCEPAGKGWRLFVAIADVSNYVQPNTPLDQEAILRGNSVYFPRRVIPMLPEKLSNKLCSLQPNCERLAMICEMKISPAGLLGDYQFYPAVISSQARLTYTQVAKMLAGGELTTHKAIWPHLQTLYALYKTLHAQRQKRGAIEFNTEEPKIKFDKKGKIGSISVLERNDAHRIVEECMLLTNTAAARFLIKHKIGGLFRIHNGPEQEKMDDLLTFLREIGLKLTDKNKPSPVDYAALLSRIQSRSDRRLIETVLLRSLSRAVYEEKPGGHFGLAYKEYCHFTSPIRRYPDLMVHRAIRYILEGGDPKEYAYSPKDLSKLGQHCSMTERRADDSVRDVVDWLKCQYMVDKVGKVFDGIVTGVVGFGLFVELNDVYIEGLVHISSLDGDYYQFDPIHHRLTGKRSGRVYRLSDAVRVRVGSVNFEDRRIDFDLA